MEGTYKVDVAVHKRDGVAATITIGSSIRSASSRAHATSASIVRVIAGRSRRACSSRRPDGRES